MSEPVEPDTDGPSAEDELSVPGSSSRSVTPTSNHGFLEQVAQWGRDDPISDANAEASSSTPAAASAASPASRPAVKSSVNTQMLLGKKGSFSPPPSRPPPGPPRPPPLPPAPITPTGTTHSYTSPPAASHPFANPSPNRNSPISKRTVSTPTSTSASASTPTSTSTPTTFPQSQRRAYIPSSFASPTPAARAASASSSSPYGSVPSVSGSSYYLPNSHPAAASSSTSTLTTSFRPGMASTSALPPALPPPTAALPELPSSVTGHRRTISISSRTSRGSKRLSQSPPRVSPRNSSLQGSQQQQMSSTSAASSSSSHASHPFASASTATLPAQSQHRTSTASKPPRTPSRHLLQTALDLAQRAVEMDKRNDVTGALAAYREAVSRLKSVMARVGVEPTENGKPRKSAGRTEEEGRTLRGIHDAYEARIVLLSSFEDAQVADEDVLDAQDQRGTAYTAESLVERDRQRASASQSTATLVPAQRSAGQTQTRSSGEGTPRPSFDDTGTGIGNFMLTGQGRGEIATRPLDSMGTSSSGHGSPEDTNITSPFSSRPLSTRTSSLHSSEQSSQIHPQPLHKDVEVAQVYTGYTATGSPIQPPPRRTSMIAQQYAQHGPSTYGSPASARYSDSSQTPNDPSSRRRTTPRTSVGIENELNIAEEEPEDGMEVLARTPHAAEPTAPRQHPLVAAQLSPRRESMPGHPMGMGLDDRDRPLPPLPNSAPVLDQGGRVVSGSHARQASGSSSSGRPPSGSFLVNPSVQQATIVQRRTSRGVDGVLLGSTGSSIAGANIDGLPTSSHGQPFPYAQQPSAGPSSAASSVHTPRSRTRSQPGSGSGRMSMDEVPPLPHTVRHRTSFTSSLTGRISSQSSQGHGNGLRINTDHSSSLVPPLNTASRSSLRSPATLTRSSSGTLISPIPEPQPPEIVHRSFHLLRLICKSMDPMSTGAYLTASIHISPAVWQPSAWSKPNGRGLVNPPRIVAQDVKFRVLETMCFHLDLINKNAGDLIDGDRAYAHGRRIPGSPEEVDRTRKEAEVLGKELAKSLGALDEDMTVGYKSLMKAGVPVGSWKEKGGAKKVGNAMSWSSKLKDKMTNGRTLESPDRYVDLLSHFSFVSQVLNEHLLNFTGLCTPRYAVMPEIQYRQVESRISSAALFFSAALVPFILDDVMQFVSRYIKGGAKYLEE